METVALLTLRFTLARDDYTVEESSSRDRPNDAIIINIREGPSLYESMGEGGRGSEEDGKLGIVPLYIVDTLV